MSRASSVMVAAVAAILLSAGSSSAGPILVGTFAGIAPEVKITTTTEEFVTGGSLGPVTSTQTLTNVAFTGTVRFDSSKYDLATLLSPGSFPYKQYREVDGSTFVPPLGIETTEWIRSTVTFGGPAGTTLTFDRDLTTAATAGSTPYVPYEGTQEITYLEGSETLAVPSLGFETGDVFGFQIANNFGFFTPDAFSPTLSPGIYAYGEGSFISLMIQSNFTLGPPFSIINLFGPGPPMAFSWTDATPATCATLCDENFTVLGAFTHFTTTSAFLGGDRFVLDSTLYQASALLFTEMTLAPEVTAVPEPATLTLLGLGAAVGGLRRLRRSRRIVA